MKFHKARLFIERSGLISLSARPVPRDASPDQLSRMLDNGLPEQVRQ